MSEKELLEAGIKAINSGNKSQAASIFAKLVQQFPNSEQGWYWLGISVSSFDQKHYCFKRVLSINPYHMDAKKHIALLTKEEPDAPPATSTSAPPLYPSDSEPLSSSMPMYMQKEMEAGKQVSSSKEAESNQKSIKKKKKKKTLLFFLSLPVSVF